MGPACLLATRQGGQLLQFLFCLFVGICFVTRSYYIIQTGFQLALPLPSPPKCWHLQARAATAASCSIFLAIFAHQHIVLLTGGQLSDLLMTELGMESGCAQVVSALRTRTGHIPASRNRHPDLTRSDTGQCPCPFLKAIFQRDLGHFSFFQQSVLRSWV